MSVTSSSDDDGDWRANEADDEEEWFLEIGDDDSHLDREWDFGTLESSGVSNGSSLIDEGTNLSDAETDHDGIDTVAGVTNDHPASPVVELYDSGTT